MTRVTHKVGDTVTLEVTIDNLSDNYQSPKLELYKTKTRTGFSDLIKVIEPADVIDNKFVFIYNTDDFVKYPMTYYGHFSVNNDGIKLNEYYKIKATY